MIGLVDALRSGRSDAMAEEQAKQLAALRLSQEARAAEQHQILMQEARAKAEDAAALRLATGKLTDAIGRKVPDPTAIAAQDQDFAAADKIAMAGGTLPKADPAVWAAPTMKSDNAGIALAMQNLAAQQRDIPTLAALQQRRRAEELDAGRREAFRKFSALTDEQLAAAYEKQNKDPSIPGALTFDAKQRKFVLTVPERGSMTVPRVDVVQGLMHEWEAEHGDVTAGLKALHEGSKERKQDARNAFADNLSLAKANEEAWKAGAAIDNQAAQTAISRGHLGVAQAAEGRHAAEFNAGAGVRQMRTDIAKLQSELAKLVDLPDTPENQDRARKIEAKLAALSTGTRAGGVRHDPADEAKANSLVAAAGIDKQTALENVILKPEQTYRNYYEASLKTLYNEEAAMQAASKAMANDGWRRLANGYWTRKAADPAAGGQGGVPTFNSVAEVEAAAKAGKIKKGDRVNVGGRTATWQ